jgi:hypothetical protein
MNVQCRSRYNHLIRQGKVSIDEAEYLAAANTSDPGYVYDDEIEVAFKNQIKILSRKSRVWSPEMVCFVYHCCMIDQGGAYNLCGLTLLSPSPSSIIITTITTIITIITITITIIMPPSSPPIPPPSPGLTLISFSED